MNRSSENIQRQARLLRLRAGLTQEQLAERAHLSVATIQRVEKGSVGVKSLNAIARAHKVDVAEFVAHPHALVVACMSEKGGVGRTTLTFNLSVLLAMRGEAVCTVQIDDQSGLYQQCRIRRDRPLPQMSSCVMPDAKLIEDWLGGTRSYSHILVDGTRYRPEINAVLIAKADVLIVPIVNKWMDEGPLQTLMEQIAEKRAIATAPILFAFNLRRSSRTDVTEELKELESRYKRPFPSAVIVDRVSLAESENGDVIGPVNSPFLKPKTRGSREACRELADLWAKVERVARG